jgi:hypothetical protein
MRRVVNVLGMLLARAELGKCTEKFPGSPAVADLYRAAVAERGRHEADWNESATRKDDEA